MPCWKSRACRPCWIRLTIKSGPGNVAIFKSRPQVGFFFVLYVVCSCLAGSMAARFCRKGLFKDDEVGRAVELLTDQVTYPMPGATACRAQTALNPKAWAQR